jgi:hypothetical protein
MDRSPAASDQTSACRESLQSSRKLRIAENLYVGHCPSLPLPRHVASPQVHRGASQRRIRKVPTPSAGTGLRLRMPRSVAHPTRENSISAICLSQAAVSWALMQDVVRPSRLAYPAILLQRAKSSESQRPLPGEFHGARPDWSQEPSIPPAHRSSASGRAREQPDCAAMTALRRNVHAPCAAGSAGLLRAVVWAPPARQTGTYWRAIARSVPDGAQPSVARATRSAATDGRGRPQRAGEGGLVGSLSGLPSRHLRG